MRINVASWNMQGWTCDGDRNAKILGLSHTLADYRSYEHDGWIVMLQEAGKPQPDGLYKNKDVDMQEMGVTLRCHALATDPTAGVERCTTAVLSDLTGRAGVNSIATKVEIYCGVGRPMVCLIVNGIVFATLHAISGGNDAVADVKRAIRLLKGMNKPWFLAGDFNADPLLHYYNDAERNASQPDTVNRLYIGTRSRNTEYGMLYSAHPTQGASPVRDSRLDYAFMDTGFIGHIAGFVWDTHHVPPARNERLITNVKVRDSGAGVYTLSDHNLIGVSVFI